MRSKLICEQITPNGILNINIQDNKIECCGKAFDIEYYIKTCGAYGIKNDDSAFIVYPIGNNLYHAINPAVQYLSGIYKSVSKRYELPGFYINENTRSAYYRIAKNASSQMCYSYTGELDFSNKFNANFFLLNELTAEQIKKYSVFLIWRNTVDRFLSSTRMIAFTSYSKNFSNALKKEICHNTRKTISFLLMLYELHLQLSMRRIMADEEQHICLQSIYIEKALANKFKFDLIIDSAELQDFITNTLNLQYLRYSMKGTNTDISWNSLTGQQKERLLNIKKSEDIFKSLIQC